MKHTIWYITLLSLYLFTINNTFSQSYCYPSIPDSITDRNQRIEYCAQHFWDNTKAIDTNNNQEKKMILDYIYLLSNLPYETVENEIYSTLNHFKNDIYSYNYIIQSFYHFIVNQDSPFHDEETSICLVKAIHRNNNETIDDELFEQLMEKLTINRVGEKATNFSFVTDINDTIELFDINSDYIILAFINPECSRCHAMIDSLISNNTLNNILKKDKFKIIIINPIDNQFNNNQITMPNKWIKGYDYSGAIVAKKLYEIRSFPSVYILDKEKKIIAKEISNYSIIKKKLSYFQNY